MSEEQVSIQEMDELMEKMFKLDQEIDARNVETAKMNAELASMKAQATENLKALGRTSYSSPHGTLGIKHAWRFNLPKTIEGKKAMFALFKQRGGEELLYQYATVNSNTYNSFCLSDWDEAKAKGEGMTYRGPGDTEPKLFETVTMRKK